MPSQQNQNVAEQRLMHVTTMYHELIGHISAIGIVMGLNFFLFFLLRLRLPTNTNIFISELISKVISSVIGLVASLISLLALLTLPQNQSLAENNHITAFLRRYDYQGTPTATNNRFIQFMSKLGIMMGFIFSLYWVGPPIYFTLTAIQFSPAANLIRLTLVSIILASAITTGAIAAYQATLGEKFKGFCGGFARGFLASIIFIGAGMVCYSLVTAIATTLDVSATTVASIRSILPSFLSLFPASPLFYAITKEFTHPGFLNEFFGRVLVTWPRVVCDIPFLACAAFFGETARLLSHAAYALHEVLNLERFQRSPQQAASPEPQVGNKLSGNAQTYRRLGIEQVADENSSPRTVISTVPAPKLAQNILREEKEEHAKSAPAPSR